MKTFVSASHRGFLFFALVGSLWSVQAQQDNDTSPVSSTSKIVEEKTTVETRRVYQTETVRKAPRKAAIFVDNRAGPQYNDKVLFLEDQVASRAGGKDFTILSREDVLKAVKVYRGADVTVNSRGSDAQAAGTLRAQSDLKATDGNGNAPRNIDQRGDLRVGPAVVRAQTSDGALHANADLAVAADGQVSETDTRSRVVSDATRNTLGTSMDQILSDSSSALRLAQNMGADFLLFVSIGSYGKETRSFNDPNLGISTKNTVYNLRGTYKVLEGVTGGTLGGDAFRESKTVRQSDTLQVDDQDTLNELLENAAAKVADGLAAKAAHFVPPAQSGKVEISIACGVKDLEGNEISLPDIRITENNTVTKDDQLLPAQASATIEIDGFAMGTTPARIKVFPGGHKLRLSRAGFDTLELTINAAEGLELTPTMQLSAAGFARWKEIRDFLNQLDNKRKMTDAQAEDIRGHAQMLRQSGFRVDMRINATNAPTFIKKNSSIYGDNF